jgi:hypothetical protein
MEERLSLQTFEKYVLVYLGAVGRGSARAGASRPLRPKRLNPQMNRRDLTRSKLWCGQRQDVRPGCVWKTRGLVQSVCRLLQSLQLVENRSVSVWFMRRGGANREAPARTEPRPSPSGRPTGAKHLQKHSVDLQPKQHRIPPP